MAPVLMAPPMEIMAPPVRSDPRHLFYKDQNCHINTEMEIQ